MPPRGGAEPGVGADTAAAVPKAPVPGRDGLLADIRGGARLKKVSEAEKRDRSAAAVPGAEPSAPPPPPSGGGGGDAQGGLAGALASALAARKSKVSHSGKFSEYERRLVRGGLLTLLQMMRRMMMIGTKMDILRSEWCKVTESRYHSAGVHISSINACLSSLAFQSVSHLTFSVYWSCVV